MAKDPYLDKDGLETFYNLMKNRLSSYCKKDESFYVTTQANEDTIPIGISGFRSTDVLFVDINGLDLVAGEDYTIDGTDIVLETPISSSGNTVHFLALRAATVTAQDYSALKGDPGDVSDVLLDGTSVVDSAGVARLVSSALTDIFHPVGSYYETDDANFDPNVAWGGTWELEAEGKVHVSAGSTYLAGTEYGSNTHTHTTGDFTLGVDHIPSHSHSYNEVKYKGQNLWGIPTYQYQWDTSAAFSSTTGNTGGGQAHNHGSTGSSTRNSWQPSIAVNRWHRIA